MAAGSPTADHHACSEDGRWYVSVPWDRAEDLHARLRHCGCPSTLCVDPDLRVARLELWPGVVPDRVLAELAAMKPRLS